MYEYHGSADEEDEYAGGGADYSDGSVDATVTNKPFKRRPKYDNYDDTGTDDNSLKAAHAFLQGLNPELVSTGHEFTRPEVTNPKQKQASMWDKMGAALSQYNTFSNLYQWRDQQAARKATGQLSYSDQELTDGVPVEFVTPLLNERNEYGDIAALNLKRQIQEDVANNTILDNLAWYEMIGYGIGQAIVDPLTYVGGAAGYGAGVGLSTVGGKAMTYLGKSAPKHAATLTKWASASAVEGALTNAPRLGGDHTYTPEEYYTDVLVETAVGIGLTGAIIGAAKLPKMYNARLAKRQEATTEAIRTLNRELEVGKAANADTNAFKRVVSDDFVMDMPLKKQMDNVLETQSYRYDMTGTQWSEFTPGEASFKVDQLLDSKTFTMDNEMQWLGLNIKDLAKQVDIIKKFQNKVDMRGVMSHSAFNNPTKANIVDLTKKLTAVRNAAKQVASMQKAVETPAFTVGTRTMREMRYTKHDNKRLGAMAKLMDEASTKLEALGEVRDKGDAYTTATRMMNDIMDVVEAGVNIDSFLVRAMKHDVFKNPDAVKWQRFMDDVGEDLSRMQAYASSRRNGATVPDSIAKEMDAVIAKFDAASSLRRIRRELSNGVPVYDNVWKVTDFPHNTKELQASINLREKDVYTPMAKDIKHMVKNTDAVSKAELNEAVKTIKLQQESLPEGVEKLTFADVENLSNPELNEVSKELLRKGWNQVTSMLTEYHGSGEHKAYQALLTPSTLGQQAAKAVSQWFGVMKDLSTKFIETDNPALNWIGTHLTELGRGYGGDVMRKHTAAVMKEAEYVRLVSRILPNYDRAVKQYAGSKGSGAVGKMMAATSAGGKNPIQKAFDRSVLTLLNDMRLGKQVNPSEEMLAFAKQWDDFMGNAYDLLASSNIKGFDGNNRIKHYAPQIWKESDARKLVKSGYDLEGLLRKAMRTENPESDASRLAHWLVNGNEKGDMYIAANDSRAVERLSLDWSVEHDGVSVMDILETDLRKLATNYSNRAAGWAAVSKASDGVLNSNLNLAALKQAAFEHKQDPKDMQVVEDVLNMLFGRPVQGGMDDWQRSIKTASVLTKLGGLGTAQLIEASAVSSRAIMESVGNPKFMKKLLKGMSPEETATDLLEIQKLTGYNWDYHLINVEAEYYTDSIHRVAEVGEMKQALNWAVDKATGGSLKQPAGRAFGHITGYNMVRKYEEAMLQRSFGMQVARHFKYGTSKMTTKRMADYGLTDVHGNNDTLKNAIDKYVEFDADGYPTKYNFDQWSQKARDDFMYSMQRAEAQELLRPLVGEMPEWFNKPWVSMLMQFRTMPIAAQNKSMGRSLAFADKEAAMQLALNCMTAGVVRHAKYAAAAGVAVGFGGEWAEEYEKQMDWASRDSMLGGAADRYITQFGGVGDVYALAHLYNGEETPEQYVTKAMNQVPGLSLIGSYVNAAYALSQGEGDTALDHAQKIMFLNNTMAFETVSSVIEAAIGDE